MSSKVAGNRESKMRKIVMIALLSLGGCSEKAPQENGPIYPQGELVGTIKNSNLYRFDDVEAGNVCYYTAYGSGIGLSCVPARYER